MKTGLTDGTLITIFLCVLVICFSITTIMVDSNKRMEKIEAIKVQNQYQIEMTKQKSIEEDKSKKRKIWEREMENGK